MAATPRRRPACLLPTFFFCHFPRYIQKGLGEFVDDGSKDGLPTAAESSDWICFDTCVSPATGTQPVTIQLYPIIRRH